MRIALVAIVLGLFAPAFAIAQDRWEPSLPRVRPPGDGWVWIPPVYRTTYQWVWREAVYRTVHDREWVPPEYGHKPEDVWENGQWVKRWKWVEIRPGYYTTRSYRVLVSPAQWDYSPVRELVTPGRWEWRPTPPPWMEPIRPPIDYPHRRPAELEPFSPLWEWPDSKKS